MQRGRSHKARKYHITLNYHPTMLFRKLYNLNNHQASLRNDSLLQSTIQRIQNDTQSDTPNNKSAKGLSPQNSLRGRSNTSSSIQQVSIEHGVLEKTNIPKENRTGHASCYPRTSNTGDLGACSHHKNTYNYI